MNSTASRYLSLTVFRTRRLVLYAGASVLDHLSWALDLGANACDSLTDRMERVAEGWPGTYGSSGSAQSRSFERSGLDRLTPEQKAGLEPVARSGIDVEDPLGLRSDLEWPRDTPPYEEEYGLLPPGSLGVSGDSGARCSMPGEQR